MIRRMGFVALLPLMVGCNSLSTQLGASCSSSDECAGVEINGGGDTTSVLSEAECVQVDDDAFCFPPAERTPTDCEDAGDCIDAAFPIEARCVDGTCVCEELECDDAASTYVVEKCACKLTSGEPCQEDDECETEVCGSEGVCLLGPGESCNRGEECASGTCAGDGPFSCT